MRVLILIPARAGSKGLPGKNTKLLGGIPLIKYSLSFAKKISENNDVICVSTNDKEVIRIAEEEGIKVPFIRPEELASDYAGTYDVILHALNYYESINEVFDTVLLMQPTSPFRDKEDFYQLKRKFDSICDMVVTIKKVKENPYFNLFEENENGGLELCKKADYKRRQDCPPVYAYNGSMYLIRTNSLKKSNLSDFQKVNGLLLPDERSIDIDDMQDWVVAEYFLKELNK